MPKTKDDRRARRQDGEKPYHHQKPHPGNRRGYSDSDNRRGGGKKGSGVDDDEHAPCPSFDAMKLKPDLLKGIYAYGFEKPSAIQQRAIRPIVRGRDVIAQSQSGTGKTVSYCSNVILFGCLAELFVSLI